jgi:flagellar basal body-associated protein FliL
VEKKGNFMLLVIIALLTLVLVTLAAYLIITSGNKKNPDTENGDPKPTIETTAPEKTYKMDQLTYFALFADKQLMKTKIDAEGNEHAVQVQINLQYITDSKEINGIKNQLERLEFYKIEIADFVISRFSTIEYSDLLNREDELKEELKEELKTEINKMLSRSDDKVTDIVYKVLFNQWYSQ